MLSLLSCSTVTTWSRRRRRKNVKYKLVESFSILFSVFFFFVSKQESVYSECVPVREALKWRAHRGMVCQNRVHGRSAAWMYCYRKFYKRRSERWKAIKEAKDEKESKILIINTLEHSNGKWWYFRWFFFWLRASAVCVCVCLWHCGRRKKKKLKT